jgi:hypothetical protein
MVYEVLGARGHDCKLLLLPSLELLATLELLVIRMLLKIFGLPSRDPTPPLIAMPSSLSFYTPWLYAALFGPNLVTPIIFAKPQLSLPKILGPKRLRHMQLLDIPLYT